MMTRSPDNSKALVCSGYFLAYTGLALDYSFLALSGKDLPSADIALHEQSVY